MCTHRLPAKNHDSPTCQRTNPRSLSVPSSPGKSPFRCKLGRTWICFNKAWSHLLMAAALGLHREQNLRVKGQHFRHLPSGMGQKRLGAHSFCCCRAGSWNYWLDWWGSAMPVPPPMPSSYLSLNLVRLPRHSLGNGGSKTVCKELNSLGPWRRALQIKCQWKNFASGLESNLTASIHSDI